MKNCILLTHQFILSDNSNIKRPKDDPDDSWKLDVFDFCVRHYRNSNPDTYIIITGHGKRPLDSTLSFADWYYWPPDIIEGEINKGHPKLVTIGLNHAKEKSIKHVCKTRVDTINLIPDIANFCHSELEKSNKSILNTFYYKDRYSLMDLFMYSTVDTQLKLFNPKKWSVPWCKDGTGPVGKNYVEDVNNDSLRFPFDLDFWEESLHKNILFLSPNTLKWVDLRKHHREFDSLSKKIKNNTLNDYAPYTWKH